MKSYNIAFAFGILLLVGASFVRDQEILGWWMVGGLLFFAVGFTIKITQR